LANLQVDKEEAVNKNVEKEIETQKKQNSNGFKIQNTSTAQKTA
jgi:hypothetical protein